VILLTSFGLALGLHWACIVSQQHLAITRKLRPSVYDPFDWLVLFVEVRVGLPMVYKSSDMYLSKKVFSQSFPPKFEPTGSGIKRIQV
jgi:hypothetical protein